MIAHEDSGLDGVFPIAVAMLPSIRVHSIIGEARLALPLVRNIYAIATIYCLNGRTLSCLAMHGVNTAAWLTNKCAATDLPSCSTRAFFSMATGSTWKLVWLVLLKPV